MYDLAALFAVPSHAIDGFIWSLLFENDAHSIGKTDRVVRSVGWQ